MDHRSKITALSLFFLIVGLSSGRLAAQDKYEKYSLMVAPDAWYNAEDGARLGIRFLGEMEGAFKEGPHRLDAGFWFATKLPAPPVSYYLSFLEPVPFLSDFGEEASIQAISSIRTGYSRHKLQFNKRWQDGFNELNHTEIVVSFSQEKLTDFNYRPFPIQWQNQWKSLIGVNLSTQKAADTNILELNASLIQNVNNQTGSFTVAKIEGWAEKELNSSFALKTRIFLGVSNNAAPEYLFKASHAQPIEWLGNGVSRASGTIPGNWLDNGLAQISGGPNLRGFTDTRFSDLTTPGYTSFASLNAEIEFPNPINSSLSSGIIGDFASLSSYLFADIGSPLHAEPVLADAGLGLQFSINIPDFLGKDRGFAVRYEVPFWISEPDPGDPGFAFRSIIGFGAIISL